MTFSLIRNFHDVQMLCVKTSLETVAFSFRGIIRYGRHLVLFSLKFHLKPVFHGARFAFKICVV